VDVLSRCLRRLFCLALPLVSTLAGATPRPPEFKLPLELKLPLPAKTRSLVTVYPLRAAVVVELTPSPALEVEALRRATAGLGELAYYPAPRKGARIIVTLRSLARIEVSREAGKLALRFRPFSGPATLETAAALYPEQAPGTIPEVPPSAVCPEVNRDLAALRSLARREPARRLARLAVSAGRCAGPARLALAEVAVRLGQYATAIEVLASAPHSQERDLLLAHAAFRAGDHALASRAFADAGRGGVEPRVVAEAHLLAGDLQRAREQLEEAARVHPASAPAVALRLADLRVLSGDVRAAAAALREAARRYPEVAVEALARAHALDGRPPFQVPAGHLHHWARLRAAYEARRWDEVEAEARTLARNFPRSRYAPAARDLRHWAFAESVRLAAQARDHMGLVRRYLEAAQPFQDELGGADLCEAAERALTELGLVIAAERALRACLRLHRAAGLERAALKRLVSLQLIRGDDASALRSLRYLAARDPLGAIEDAAFWLDFGNALWRTGAFEEAVPALQRAQREGDAEIRRRARTALGRLLWRTGHRQVGSLLLGMAPDAPGPTPEGGPGGPDLSRVSAELSQVWERVARGIRALTE
jgi:tetratricopeptide (TPR) repeat protein